MNELMISVNKSADRKAQHLEQEAYFQMASRAYDSKRVKKPESVRKIRKPKKDYLPTNLILLGLLFLEMGYFI